MVDGFRALAVRQVERGRLADNPGATAHEVADALAAEYPAQPDRVRAGARSSTRCCTATGRPPASRRPAVLALDDDLVARR